MSRRRDESYIRHEISLEGTGTDIIFLLEPSHSGRWPNYNESIAVVPETSALIAPRRLGGETVEYRLYTARTPASRGIDSYQPREGGLIPPSPLLALRYLQIPREGLDDLKQLAQDVVARAAPSPDASRSAERHAADTLVTYLRDSGEFTYTLNAAIMDPKVDPVEDFLFNRRSGHCEYYATALALMLRANGIPARMITGYKGAYHNVIGGFYEVQQRHAHAWVEAFIDDHWVTLDATPAARDTELSEDEGPAVFGVIAVLQNLWNEYVVNLNRERQQAFFDPVQDAFESGLQSIQNASGEQGSGVLSTVRHVVSSPDRLFSWQGGLISFVLLLVVGGVIFGIRAVVARIRRLIQPPAASGARVAVRVEFYERFLSLMENVGLKPDVSQTPREFAAVVRKELPRRVPALALSGEVALLAESFYDVRFGGEKLSAAELARLDAQLAEMAQKLQGSGNSAAKA